MIPSDEDAEREIRVALVLYGGVSLAIYENGVTQTFHDLVRREGIFDIVLGLLRARANVDVIAGTSAGGINGLILGACLESGADFKSTADLWRRLGDFGALLRDVRGADQAESLLDGEGYYHEELLKAFRALCKPVAGWQSPGEIDVFITGTDLDGHARRYADSLGAEMSDKEHRLVFHLKHRPDRAWLGLPGAKTNADDVDRQASILAALARITSSFPIAFPAFRTGQLSTDGDAVASALESLSSVGAMKRRWMVDGGVLDNKPFGPVLNAIFYRMPTVPVERRLFYVEPDPEPFLEKTDAHDGSVTTSVGWNHSPFGIAGASLSTIPAHEGIASDLDRLLEHNQRVRWLRQLQDELIDGDDQSASDAPAMAQYRLTRVESLARLLVLETDVAPSAQDYPTDKHRSRLLDLVRSTLLVQTAPKSGTKGQGDDLTALDRFDVSFQQRLAFYVLYALHDAADVNGHGVAVRRAMRECGRLIKTLEIVYATMIDLRDDLVPRLLKRELDATTVETIVAAFRRLLAADAQHWLPLVTALGEQPADVSDYLSRDLLSGVRAASRAVAKAIASGDSTAELPAGADTILDRISAVLSDLAESCRGRDGESIAVARWAALDRSLFPIEFTSGLHERDEIRFVRVSPADAQTGLSRRNPREKVAGDELAHFSSFLRRDWRSNDLLYGRLDGICQTLRSLLDAKALLRALLRDRGGTGVPPSEELFAEATVRQRVPGCSAETLNRLRQSWTALAARTEALIAAHQLDAKALADAPVAVVGDEVWSSSAEAFREALIMAGQEHVFQSDFPELLADHYFQEIAYGRQSGPTGTGPGSSPTAIQGDSAALAQRDAAQTSAPQQFGRFLGMQLGSQPIIGALGGVPNDVVGGYVTSIYLLAWGLLRRSLGSRGRLLDGGRVRWLFRTPVAFFNYVFTSMRRDRISALGAVCIGLGLLLGFGWAAYTHGEWGVVALVAGIAVVTFVLVTPDGPRWPRFAALFVALLIGAAGVLGKDASSCLNAKPNIWAPAGVVPHPCASLHDASFAPIVLEFASDRDALVQVLGNSDVVWKAAERLVQVDYIFIAAYSLLVISLALALWPSVGRLRKAFLAAAIACIVVTALFDIKENLGLLAALREPIEPVGVASAATRKWGAFFIALLFLPTGFLLRSRLWGVLALIAWAAAALGLLGLATSHLFLIHIAFQCSLGAAGVIVLILFLNPPMATPRGASPAVVDPIFQRPAPVLFAHRGGRLEVPESTERAFHHAVDALKVDVLELDVQLTKDGRFVVWHGPNLSNVVIDGIPSDPKRRTKAQNDIREYAWKDLDGKAFVADPLTRKSDDAFQHDRRLLLLEEALQKFPHTHINLVLKCRGFGGRIGAEHVADLVKILDAHRNGRTILVGSGSRAVLAELRKQTKGRYPTGLGLIEAIATMPKAALGFLSHPGMRGRALQTSHAGWVSPRWLVAEVQNAGGAVHVFLTGFPLTRNLDGTDPTATNLPPQEALHAVLARGVHGVMTDRPTRVKEMLATWRQRPGGGFPGA